MSGRCSKKIEESWFPLKAPGHMFNAEWKEGAQGARREEGGRGSRGAMGNAMLTFLTPQTRI